MSLANNTTPSSGFSSLIQTSSRYINHKLCAYKYNGGIFSAYDTVRKEKVLIRTIINPYESENTIIKILNEIKLMKYFAHDNIIQLYAIEEHKKDALFFVTEFMETELDSILKSPQVITNDHIIYFIYCILRGLVYIHSAEVVVGNIILQEIFVNSREDIKIGSFFGSIGSGKEILLEDFCINGFSQFLFLAPEYILNKEYITTKSDIWSVGCIMAALLGRQLLFRAEDYLQQVTNFIDILGSPSEEDLYFMSDNAADYIRRIPEKTKREWSEFYPNADPLALEFLDKMLKFNPLKRWDAESLMKHPYMADIFSDEDIGRLKEWSGKASFLWLVCVRAN